MFSTVSWFCHQTHWVIFEPETETATHAAMQQPTHDIAKKGGGGGEEHPGDSSLFNGEKGRRERGGFILLLPLGGPAHLLAPNPKLAPRPTTDCKRPELHFETSGAYRFPFSPRPSRRPKGLRFTSLNPK